MFMCVVVGVKCFDKQISSIAMFNKNDMLYVFNILKLK